MLGKCPICTNHRELTKHHVIEAPPDNDGNPKTVGLCEECHTFHEKYKNILWTNFGIEIDRRKLES